MNSFLGVEVNSKFHTYGGYMSRPSRFISVLTSVAVLALTLVPISSSQAAVIKITFANWQFAEPGRGEALQAIVDAFNASNKRIQVQTVSIPYASYSNTVLTQMGAKSGPDILNLEYDVFLKAQQANLVADLTGKIQAPTSGFLKSDANYNLAGKRFGIPWQSTGFALICNKSILAEEKIAMPKTFEQFVAMAKATTSGTTRYGFAFRNTMPQEAGWWYDLSNWVYGFGGTWTDKSGNPTVNTDEVVKALTEYKKFFDEKYVPQGADATTYRRMFWENKIACVIDNGAVPSIFVNGNPAIKSDLLVGPNPFPVAKNSQILIGTHINAASKNQAAAVSFMKWMLQASVQKSLQRAMGAEAVSTNIRPPKELLATSPWMKTYQSIANNGVLVLPVGAELKTAEFRKIVLSQADKVLRSGLSPKAAMDAAQAEVKTLLSK